MKKNKVKYMKRPLSFCSEVFSYCSGRPSPIDETDVC
jgi:hypothetical protein